MKKGLIYITISNIAFVITGYLTNIWLGRRLGPETYGSYGLVLSVWTIVNLILTSGFPHAVSKFVSANQAEPDDILKTALKLQFLLIGFTTSIYIVLIPTISAFLHDNSLIPYLRLTALIIPFYSLYSLYIGYYNGLHKFVRQSTMSIVYALAKGLCIIGFSYIWGMPGALIGFAIAPIIALGTGIKFPKSNTTFPYKNILTFSSPIIAFTLLMTAVQQSDLYLVKILLLDARLPGFYTAIQNIAIIPFYLMGSVSLILFPSISKSSQNSSVEKTAKLITQSLRYVLIILLPVTAAISASSMFLIKLLYSAKYSPASQTLTILIWSYAALTIFAILANILNGSGSPYKSLLSGACGLLVSILMCLILIPRFGINGAAISTGLGALSAATVAGIAVFSQYKVLFSLISTIKVFFSTVVLFVIIKIIPFIPIGYIVGAIAYTTLLIILRESTVQEWKKLVFA